MRLEFAVLGTQSTEGGLSAWAAFWQQSGSAAVWLLAIGLVFVVIGLVRLGSWLLRRYRSNRLLPVVVCEDRALLGGNGHRGNGNGHNGGDHNGGQGHESARTAELAAYITEHMAADTLGPNVLTPGSGSTIGPDPAPETTSSPHGWMDVMKRLALFRPQAYHVMLHCLSADDERLRFSVRILYMPKNTVVAATIMEAEASTRTGGSPDGAERELYDRIACYCTVKVLADPRSKDRIPRWESWGDDPAAYRFYRMGIKAQELALELAAKGRSRASKKQAQRADKHYAQAAELVPGNLPVRLYQAGFQELIAQTFGVRNQDDRIRSAVDIYTYCVRLWPEHIETAYRLAIARAGQGGDRGAQADDETSSSAHLGRLIERLSRRAIIRRYARTWLPGRRNLGERRYWRRWFALERPRPSLRTRRRSFLGAVRIAHAAEVLRVNPNAPRPPDGLPEAFCDVASEVAGGRARWGRRRGGRDWGMRRLLYADHARDEGHAGQHEHSRALTPGAAPRHRGSNRAAAGHLVHYNAACFLSLALAVDAPADSGDWSDDEWREDCARAAVTQLNTSLRVTRSQFSIAWAETDTDLRPLLTGRLPHDPRDPLPSWGQISSNWARSAGIRVTDESSAAWPRRVGGLLRGRRRHR
ncbi:MULTISPECIES: hypothetical protein [unclassified Streptomyces]|uniref:hypothetical protein n=1 Tax=unclassified Streptomyces TaxID=2593676 RepID=UPI003D93C488